MTFQIIAFYLNGDQKIIETSQFETEEDADNYALNLRIKNAICEAHQI